MKERGTFFITLNIIDYRGGKQTICEVPEKFRSSVVHDSWAMGNAYLLP